MGEEEEEEEEEEEVVEMRPARFHNNYYKEVRRKWTHCKWSNALIASEPDNNEALDLHHTFFNNHLHFI